MLVIYDIMKTTRKKQDHNDILGTKISKITILELIKEKGQYITYKCLCDCR